MTCIKIWHIKRNMIYHNLITINAICIIKVNYLLKSKPIFISFSRPSVILTENETGISTKRSSDPGRLRSMRDAKISDVHCVNKKKNDAPVCITDYDWPIQEGCYDQSCFYMIENRTLPMSW